jgi:DNA-binding NarL/FixJ family response regulator
MDTRVTVLIVCNRSFLRAYLRLVIEGRPRFRVIEEVNSPAVAIATAGQKRPRLVLLEYHQSEAGIIGSIRRMTQEQEGVCLLVGTAEQASRVAEQAREWGVGAVVIDNDRPKDLIKHLEQMGSRFRGKPTRE